MQQYGFQAQCMIRANADIPFAVEYQQSNLIEKTLVNALNNSLNPDFGLLRAGRRLINIPLRRFSDDAPCEFHDGTCSSTLVLTPTTAV